MASNYPTDFTAILSFGKSYAKTVKWVDKNGYDIPLTGKEVIWTVETPGGRIIKYPPPVDLVSNSIYLQLTPDEIATLFPAFITEPAETPYSALTPGSSVSTQSSEMGSRFTTGNTGGWVTGIRWYRPAGDTVTSRKFNIWNSAGVRVTSVTTSNESGSGWRTISIPTYHEVGPNETFTVSVTNLVGQLFSFIFPASNAPGSSAHLSASSVGTAYLGVPDTYPSGAGSAWYGIDCVFEPNPVMQYPHKAYGTHKLVVKDSTGDARVIKGTVALDTVLPEDFALFAEDYDIQIFGSPGSYTWTKPANAALVSVQLVGGGGGGGSGRRGAAGTNRIGGDGGTGGGFTKWMFRATDVGPSEAVVVGAGGAGGIAQTVDSTNGNAGTAGGNSLFGNNKLVAGGGPGGAGGASVVTNGSAFSVGTYMGIVGIRSNLSVLPINATFSLPGTGGGGGGGAGGGYIDTGNTVGVAGDGLAGWNGITTAIPAGVNGVSAPGNGNSNGLTPGCGGAGGGSSNSAAGQAGGNGGLYGGGGGGGAGSLNTFNSGAGGNGVAGFAVVITVLTTQ